MDEIDFTKDVTIAFLSTSALLLTITIALHPDLKASHSPAGTITLPVLIGIDTIALIVTMLMSLNFLTELLEKNKEPESPARTKRLKRIIIMQGTPFLLAMTFMLLIIFVMTNWG